MCLNSNSVSPWRMGELQGTQREQSIYLGCGEREGESGNRSSAMTNTSDQFAERKPSRHRIILKSTESYRESMRTG